MRMAFFSFSFFRRHNGNNNTPLCAASHYFRLNAHSIFIQFPSDGHTHHAHTKCPEIHFVWRIQCTSRRRLTPNEREQKNNRRFKVLISTTHSNLVESVEVCVVRVHTMENQFGTNIEDTYSDEEAKRRMPPRKFTHAILSSLIFATLIRIRAKVNTTLSILTATESGEIRETWKHASPLSGWEKDYFRAQKLMQFAMI